MTDVVRGLGQRLLDFDDNWHEATCKEAADRIEALEAENERLRMSKRCLRLGLYGLMDSHDADAIATTIEAGGVVSWDKYPPSARAALKEIEGD